MNADELNRLADRCEAASAEQQHDLLAEAFSALTGAFVATPSAIRFMRILGAEAYLDAAMTLVPEGWGKVCRDDDDRVAFARLYSPDFDSLTFGKGSDWITTITAGQEVKAYGATWPLALTAACLRAIAAQPEQPGSRG